MTTPGAFLLLWMSLVFPANSALAASKVIFKAETVKIFVASRSVQVEGSYSFTANSTSPLVAGLFYPLPIDSTHTFPDSIRVTSGGNTLSYRMVEGGILFSVRLSPGRLTAVDVFYSQSCLDKTACYILTSTAEWDAPLENAAFEIHVPADLELSWSAYAEDEASKGGGITIHRFSRRNFMPDKDLCLRWRERQKRLPE